LDLLNSFFSSGAEQAACSVGAQQADEAESSAMALRADAGVASAVPDARVITLLVGFTDAA